MNKINVSAIVVGLNESSLLVNCINSISFCNEILYFDLGSSDSSMDIAKDLGAKVIQHKRVLSCEWIHAKYAKYVSNDWVLIIDPDEVVDASLSKDLIKRFESIEYSPSIGALMVPWKFYFKNKGLNGTAWGGENSRFLLVNKHRFSFTAEIHTGRKVSTGYELLQIKRTANNVVHHFWMKDFKSLVSKHKRYLQNEGEARYNSGIRSSLLKILYTPASQFYFSFIIKKGYKDLGVGLLLSIFWAWYQTCATVKVYQFQKNTQR